MTTVSRFSRRQNDVGLRALNVVVRENLVLVVVLVLGSKALNFMIRDYRLHPAKGIHSRLDFS